MREWSLSALVALEALQLFVAAPLAATGQLPRGVDIGLGVAIVATILVIVGESRRAVLAVLAATAVEAAALVLRLAHPGREFVAIDFSAALIFFLALSIVLVTVVFGGGRITVHRIQGAIAIYLNVALIFALAYRLIGASDPSAFAPVVSQQHGVFAFAYFSFETLTTSGYGDIVPVNPFARSLANLESVIGQLYPATILARLVTLELEARRKNDAD